MCLKIMIASLFSILPTLKQYDQIGFFQNFNMSQLILLIDIRFLRTLIIEFKQKMNNSNNSENLSFLPFEQYRHIPQIREGDWVCVRCSNFNFSFRTTCNRCRIQTRDTNFFEFVFPSVPLIKVTEPQAMKMEDTHQELQEIFESNKENNPFQSAILLTPVKNQRPQYDSQPYKSPSCLPSVSPLLKKYNSQRNQKDLNTAKTRSSLFNMKDVHVSEFTIEETRHTKYQEPDEYEQDIQYHISKLLASIDL